MGQSPELFTERIGIVAGIVWHLSLHGTPSGQTEKATGVGIEGLTLINQPTRRLHLGHLKSKWEPCDKNPKVL